MDPLVLFNSLSVAPDSPTFELRDQRTIMAIGMQPGDYIAFEILQVTEGVRARICGCRVTPDQLASIAGVQELQCPGCNDNFQRPVRLTAQNPVVILDYPQNTLLRAVYYGEGLALRSVQAWVTETSTPDLTDTLRGCPPIYYAADELVWIDTGAIRCLPDGLTVEVEQINQCGERRWEEAAYDQNWQDTGAIRCLPDGATVELEQVNRCGDRRWAVAPYDQNWQDTGAIRCLEDEVSVEIEQVNRCGDRRWVAAPYDQNWQDTGVVRCLADETTIEEQEVNRCGTLRWVESADVQTWVDTANTRCVDGFIHQEQSNDCGQRRWLETAVECDVGASVHAVVSLLAAPTSGVEGTEFCWTLVLDSPVTGAPLVVETTLSGIEDTIHNYVAPVGVIDIGETGVVLCVGTFDDADPEATRELCLSINPNARLTGIPGAVCVDVTDDDETESASTHTILSVIPLDDDITEGATAQWLVSLNAPVAVEGLLINFTLSGTEQGIHGYAAPSLTIPVGNSSGVVSVVTTDDAVVEDIQTLGITALTSARVTGVPGASFIEVLDNDVADPSDSIHTVLSVVGAPDPAAEGTTINWTVTLDAPVANSPLTLIGLLSGDEQGVHGYSVAPLVIGIGASSGIFSVVTTDDTIDEATRQLCLEVQTSARVTSVPAAECVDITDNDASIHTIVSIVPVDNDIIEGENAQWTVTLSSAVNGGDLLINFTLGGDEQGVHGYAAPTLTVTNGNSGGIVTVPTTDDLVDEPARALTLTALTSARVTSVPAASSINVVDNDEPAPSDSIHTVISVVGAPDPAVEGTTINWTVTLNAPVVNSPLLVFGTLSGAEQAVHGYAAPSVSIPVGNSSGILSVVTTDDLVDEATFDLCLTVDTSPRIISVPAADCVSITDNDAPPAASLPASFGGACFIDNPNTAVSEYYITFLTDGTVRGKTLAGFSSSTWLPVGASAADYEVRVDDTSDAALTRGGSTRGAWHAMTATRSFTWQALGPGVDAGFVGGTVRVRRIGEVTDDDTATINAATFVGVNTECP